MGVERCGQTLALTPFHQMFGNRSKYSSSSFLPPSPLPSAFSDSTNSMRSIHLTSRKEGLSRNRNRERDYCLLLLMFRHGLRVSEACQLKVTNVNLKEKIIHIHRLKSGNATTQPMYNGEVGA